MVPLPYIGDVFILLNASIFPYGIRPMTLQFLVFLHYPNQVLRTRSTTFTTWSERNKSNGKYFEMNFAFKSMDIVRRRNKRSKNATTMEIMIPIIWNHSCPRCNVGPYLGYLIEIYQIVLLKSR